MAHIISPYDRDNDFAEAGLSLAMVISVGIHVAVFWAVVFVFPTLMSNKRDRMEDVITVQLLGALAPAAPAAPEAKVNPELKGPDVVELPKSDPAPTPQPRMTPPAPAEVVAPADVIPLGPKAPDKPPKIEKAAVPPPKVTPPKVEPDKPKPAKPNDEAALNKRMQELQRKVEAERLDDDINSRVANIAVAQGRGAGEGSESGGATDGQRIHPEKLRYYSHIKDIVSSNWVPPAGTLSSNLEAHYWIKIELDGRVTSARLVKSSGNPDFDLSVERAVTKSSPFPPLPAIFEGQPDNPVLKFTPKDLRTQRG